MLLYIHIPFCDSKCHYCSFVSYTKNHDLKRAYFEALTLQLEHELQRAESLKTVFIGGGTPSCAEWEYYEKIFDLISPYLLPEAEITAEANPTGATKEWLLGMRSLGVNRISLGVQSFNDAKLKFLGRSHTSKEALSAVYRAQEAGFERISCDIIYQCSIDNKRLIDEDLDILLSLPIEHVSAYELTIEEQTAFYGKEVKNGEEPFYLLIGEKLQDKFSQYEVSNYGRICMHNLGYWMHEPYIGVGCGAVGFYDSRRFYSQRDLRAYIKDPLKTRIETLSRSDLLIEKLFLGLRSVVGVERELLPLSMRERADDLVGEKLTLKNGRYYAKNLFLADELALYILGETL